MQEPPLLREKFPSSWPAASVRPLAPGCRREVASAPSQPGTPPNRHLAQADPYPRGCHRRLCAEGLGEATKLLRWALPPRERRGAATQHPAPGPDPWLARSVALPRGVTGAPSPSAPPSPRRRLTCSARGPHGALSVRAPRPPTAGLLGSLAGIFRLAPHHFP